MSKIPDHIFKAYDIRGLTDGELSEELAYLIGRGFVTFLREQGIFIDGQKIVVGYDMRKSSLKYHERVIAGITDEGVDAIDIGFCSTPLFNFACAHYDNHAGGIMVTASHNPAEYNGFKLTMGDGIPVGRDSGMARVQELVMANAFPPSNNKGTLTKMNVRDDYFARVFSLVPPETIKPLTIVIDGGNGVAEVTVRDLMKRLPVQVEWQCMEPDGTFPNHEANPIKTQTLRDLQQRVVEIGADFGFAFDGDADRVGVVDNTGAVVDASFVGALIGLEMIDRLGPGHMLYDLRSSQVLKEVWEERGSTTQMCMVGHALIKGMMRETNAMFASELSLHLYYKDMYGMESGDLSLLLLLSHLSKANKPLTELIAPLRRYAHSGEINFSVPDKDAMIEKIADIYRPEAVRQEQIDGLWFGFPWGWFNLRKSNTEPILRLNLEAETEAKMKEEAAKIRMLIQEATHAGVE